MTTLWQDAAYWEEKAHQAKRVADKMTGEAAKAVMFDLVEYYEERTRAARIIAAMLESVSD